MTPKRKQSTRKQETHEKATKQKEDVGNEVDVDDFDHNDPDDLNLPHDDGIRRKPPILWPTFSLLDLASPDVTLEWKTYDQELLYSVKELQFPSSPSSLMIFLHRENEDAYQNSCLQSFSLPLFPIDQHILQHFPHLILQHDFQTSLPLTSSSSPSLTTSSSPSSSFREEFFHLSRLIKAIRIRKIVLLDTTIKTKSKILQLENFLKLCEIKLSAQLTRLTLLEKEFNLLEQLFDTTGGEREGKGNNGKREGFKPNNNFSTFLALEVGWSTTVNYLVKEFRYNLTTQQQSSTQQQPPRPAQSALLQSQESAQEDHAPEPVALPLSGAEESLQSGKEIEKILQRQGFGFTCPQIHDLFLLMKYWQLIFSISLRAFVEKDSIYRTHCRYTTTTTSATAATTGTASGTAASKKDFFRSQSSMENKSKRKQKKPPTKNQLKRTISLAPSRDYDDAELLQQGLLSDDDEEEEEGKGEEKGEAKREVEKQHSKKQIQKQESLPSSSSPPPPPQLMNPLLPSGNLCLVPWNDICQFLAIPLPSSYSPPLPQPSDEEDENLSTSPAAPLSPEYEEYTSVLHATKAIIEIFSSSSTSQEDQEQTSSSSNSHRPFLEYLDRLDRLRRQVDIDSPSVISKATIAELIFHHHELTANVSMTSSSSSSTTIPPLQLVESTRTIGVVLLALADDLGKVLEELFLNRYRRLNIWTATLENMRRARVKREGGQLILRDNGEVEVDEQGAIRVIPNADEIVDTDILHGNRQRVRIQVDLPFSLCNSPSLCLVPTSPLPPPSL
jgi:hypothetical protein